MNGLKPQLLLSLRNYSKHDFMKDLIAGVIVAIIALPLSIALALASGVSPEQGLYTAIVAGFVISAFGGSKVQIAGPTAAFATIVAGVVARNGMEGLAVATILAGLILIAMGMLHMGSMIKFIPYTITTGFTAGIAVTIVIGQIKDFLGLTFQTAPIEIMDKLDQVITCIGTTNYTALVVGCVALAVLVLWPKVSKTIPSSLMAVLVTAAMVKLMHLPVNTIGDLYTISSAAPSFHLPAISYDTVAAVLPDAFTIAVLVITFLLTVIFDLVVAIVVGLTLACLLFMKRMADESHVKEWDYVEDSSDDQGRLKPVPAHVMVYEIIGPMFFGAADKIPHLDAAANKKVLVLRMKAVPAMDVTALNSLSRLWLECYQEGIHVVFSHVNEQPMSVFRKAGFIEKAGEENFQPNIDAALERAVFLENRQLVKN